MSESVRSRDESLDELEAMANARNLLLAKLVKARFLDSGNASKNALGICQIRGHVVGNVHCRPRQRRADERLAFFRMTICAVTKLQRVEE